MIFTVNWSCIYNLGVSFLGSLSLSQSWLAILLLDEAVYDLKNNADWGCLALLISEISIILCITQKPNVIIIIISDFSSVLISASLHSHLQNSSLFPSSLHVAAPSPWQRKNGERGSIALHIGKSVPPGMSCQNPYPDLGREVSLVWNFCAHSSDVISWENQWWGYKMPAVFPSEFLAWSNRGLEGRLGMKLLCFKLTNSKKAKKSCFQLTCTFYLFSPSRPPPPPPTPTHFPSHSSLPVPQAREF